MTFNQRAFALTRYFSSTRRLDPMIVQCWPNIEQALGVPTGHSGHVHWLPCLMESHRLRWHYAASDYAVVRLSCVIAGSRHSLNWVNKDDAHLFFQIFSHKNQILSPSYWSQSNRAALHSYPISRKQQRAIYMRFYKVSWYCLWLSTAE